MKFGVDAPWYKDVVERAAFNLYAMECEKLNEIAEEIMIEHAGESFDLYDLQAQYGLDENELTYIYNYISERC